jgi:D-lactate dehydrogenase
MHGFGCRILAYDLKKNEELIHEYGVEYTSLSRLSIESDIITLHTPLNTDTRYLLNKDLMSQMKNGVMIINTSRGGVINTAELIKFLEKGTIGYCGLDVYEKERGIFFFDHSGNELEDPMLTRLMALPNVLITPHQGLRYQGGAHEYCQYNL